MLTDTFESLFKRLTSNLVSVYLKYACLLNRWPVPAMVREPIAFIKVSV